MRIAVHSQQGSYPVYIENHCFLDRIRQISHRHPNVPIAIITDRNVYKLYQQTISSFLQKNPQIHCLVIPAGEKQKNIQTKIRLERQLFEYHFNRESVLIAWGGGVIGDLVGFLASTYMRGIPYYAFPTSVISMVDSSIGGKTGIDTPYGKNLIGTIYPPRGVYIDTNFLSTLPHREFINGCAEIAKYYFIQNPTIGKLIGSTPNKFEASNYKLMGKVIKESLKVKVKVVENDETEKGLRRILNFGHTFGHAVEHYSKFRLKHGYAIAIGMGVESYWALRKKQVSIKSFTEIVSLLNKLRLPTAIPQTMDNYKCFKELYQISLQDKKSKNRKVYFVCLREIGKVKTNSGQYREPISESEFINFLKEYNQFLKTHHLK